MRTAFGVSLLLLFTTAASAETARALIDQVREATIVPSRAAADRSLKQLVGLAEDNAQFGFLPADKIKGIELEEALPIVMVRLDRLRSYDPVREPDPTALLTGTNRVFRFVGSPINHAISGVEVMKKGDSWIPARLGLSTLAENARATLEKNHVQANAALLIEIPALRLQFIGFDVNGTMTVAALDDSPTFGIIKHQPNPLGQVLSQLVPWAKQHNGLPS